MPDRRLRAPAAAVRAVPQCCRSEVPGARRALVVARESVVRDRLPGRGVGDELARGRPHGWIAVERAEADANLRRIVRVAAEQLAAALAAEELLEAAVRVPPGLHELLSLHHPQRAAVDPGVRRGRGAGAALAARAVTVARLLRRLRQLEANAAAQAASRHRWLGHAGEVCQAAA